MTFPCSENQEKREIKPILFSFTYKFYSFLTRLGVVCVAGCVSNICREHALPLFARFSFQYIQNLAKVLCCDSQLSEVVHHIVSNTNAWVWCTGTNSRQNTQSRAL